MSCGDAGGDCFRWRYEWKVVLEEAEGKSESRRGRESSRVPDGLISRGCVLRWAGSRVVPERAGTWLWDT